MIHKILMPDMAHNGYGAWISTKPHIGRIKHQLQEHVSKVQDLETKLDKALKAIEVLQKQAETKEKE